MEESVRRLPCSNIGEFIDEKKVFYKIKGHSGLDKGEEVDLYKGDFTYRFKIGYIHNVKGDHVLALVPLE